MIIGSALCSAVVTAFCKATIIVGWIVGCDQNGGYAGGVAEEGADIGAAAAGVGGGLRSAAHLSTASCRPSCAAQHAASSLPGESSFSGFRSKATPSPASASIVGYVPHHTNNTTVMSARDHPPSRQAHQPTSHPALTL